ncbi:hypothetical protein [Haloferax sp. Atlit-12N]|uniref:hypothetical protein n=1 Tax=Haloferax sp. Atlit-12N TaxID=2077203 RepID=UPI0011E59C4E|nr:hypothetical protein [Haloferax sp. Atlit-12N]
MNEEGPSEEDEQKARKRTLEIGNRTEIKWREAKKGERTFYKRLDDHNRDCYWKYRDEIDVSKDYDNQFKRESLLALAGQLCLNSVQRRMALNRFFRLNLWKFGMRSDVVAFCICGLILKKEAKRYGDKSPYHPARNPENNSSPFARVESQLIESDGRTTKNYIQKVWGKLEQGNPPTRSKDEWKPFVRSHSDIQNHPSHSPDWA